MQRFESVLTQELSAQIYFTCLAAAFICGIITALAVSVKNKPSKSFVTALVLLPMIVETVILMVNGNLGTGVAVMGAFSLVRFRSVPGKAKDIAAIFMAMTSGLACAAGFLAVAIIFTLAVCLVMIALSFIPFGTERELDLHITIPETLRIADEFEDLFKSFTKTHRLVKVKTSNMGSLYTLHYKITLKDKNKTQEFIDNVRCRNGNLEVSVAESAEGVDEL